MRSWLKLTVSSFLSLARPSESAIDGSQNRNAAQNSAGVACVRPRSASSEVAAKVRSASRRVTPTREPIASRWYMGGSESRSAYRLPASRLRALRK